MEKVFAVYTDCTLITIKLSLVKYLTKIRRQIIGYCPAVYFISEPTKMYLFCQLYINKYYNTYLLLLLHLTFLSTSLLKWLLLLYPVTSEYKTLYKNMPCYLYLGIKYFVAPREFYSVGKGTATVFASDPVTAVSLSGRDRAMCLNHYLPPSKRRLFLCLPCLLSHRPRWMQTLRLRCAPSGLWGFTSTVRQSDQLFVCYGGCAKGRAVSNQRLCHWIVDAIMNLRHETLLYSPTR